MDSKQLALIPNSKSVCQLHLPTKVIYCLTFTYFKLNLEIILQNSNVDVTDDYFRYGSVIEVMELIFFQQNQSCVKMQIYPISFML